MPERESKTGSKKDERVPTFSSPSSDLSESEPILMVRDRLGREWGPQWNMDLQSYAEKSALKFESTRELDSFIDHLWNNDDFKEMPRAHVGDNTLIVPSGAVRALRKRGFSFLDSRVIPAAELSVGQINQLRQDRGSF